MTPAQRTAFLELVEKYLNGVADAEEVMVLEKYYQLFSEAPEALDQLNVAEVAAMEASLNQKIKIKIGQAQNREERTRKPIPLYRRWEMIAAAVATIVFGVWFFAYRSSNTGDSLQTGVYANDIAPGKNGATVTLSTGEVIPLDSTKQGVKIDPTSLTYDDGSKGAGFGLKNGSEVQMTAQTQKGQTYIFTLPDGSKVWLNAATTLKFPSTFANKISREVEVDGEAYFEVFKNKSQPFVVKTKKLGNSPEQEITVLGTHFNVNSYADESGVTTTLLEGSVRVTRNLEETKILKPGEQALNTGNSLRVSQVDTDNAIGWKEGRFRFNDTPLDEVLRQMSRWYNVSVQYPDGVPDLRFTGDISRNVNVSVALDILRDLKVKFSLRDHVIIVTK